MSVDISMGGADERKVHLDGDGSACLIVSCQKTRAYLRRDKPAFGSVGHSVSVALPNGMSQRQS